MNRAPNRLGHRHPRRTAPSDHPGPARPDGRRPVRERFRSTLTALAALAVALPGCGRRPAAAGTGTSSPAVATPATPAPTHNASRFEAVKFDPRTNRRRSLLTGDGANPLPDGSTFLISHPRVTTYDDAGRPAWTIETPQCYFDRATELVRGAGEVHAFTDDGRYSIRGEGFTWREADAHLFISNHVHTIIRRSIPTNGPTATVPPLEVFADQFDYQTGLAVYRGQVRAQDPNGTLSCERLTARFIGQGGQIDAIVAEQHVTLEQKDLQVTGARAVYAAAKNTIEVTGHPTWRSGAREGRADRLQVARATRRLRADGHVVMRLPRDPAQPGLLVFSPRAPAPNTPATASRHVEISADHLDYRPGSAHFLGRVRARSADNQLACARLTVTFTEPGGEVESVLAADHVVIANPTDGSRATADRAVYTAADGLVELTGHPVWRAGAQAGQADQLWFNTRARSIRAEGRVVMRPLSAGLNPSAAFLPLAPFATNAAAAPREPLSIRSQHLDFRPGRAVFHGAVRLEETSGALRCETLTVTLAEPGNRFQTIEAAGGVNASQGDNRLVCERLTARYANNGQLSRWEAENSVEFLTRQGTNSIDAIGTRALYTAASRTLELTGQALLQTAQVTASGDALVWDQVTRSLRMKGLRHSVFKPPPRRPTPAPSRPD